MGKKSKQKQNQVRSHSDWPCVLLFDLAHKQCNGIIKGWVHCHTSEWKGRFLVNNILFGSACCAVMVEIQFSLIKEIKIGRPEHLLTPHPSTSDNISFLSYSPHPPILLPTLKEDVICVSPLTVDIAEFRKAIKDDNCVSKFKIFCRLFVWASVSTSLDVPSKCEHNLWRKFKYFLKGIRNCIFLRSRENCLKDGELHFY